MRRSLAAGCSLAALIVLAGCASGGRGGGGTSTEVAQATSTSEAALITTLLGTYPGEATATALGSRTRVSIMVRGAPSGAAFAWQLKRGMCSNAAGALDVGRPSSYPTLIVRGDGVARFSGAVSVVMEPGTPHFIHVFRSRSDATVVACGDLRPT